MWASSLWADLKYGARRLSKAPVVSLAAAISLGLGIAANTINFSVANGFMLEPFPYEDQQSLAIVWEVNRSDTQDDAVAPGNFHSWRERSRSFQDLIAYEPGQKSGVLISAEMLVPAGRTSKAGSTNPVGRTNCSATSPECSSS